MDSYANFFSMNHYDGIFLGFNVEPKLHFPVNVVHLYLFFGCSIYSHNQRRRASKPKHKWQSLTKVFLQIGGLLLPFYFQ